MPTFVTPSGTARPWRPLREFNDCNLPKGSSDGGRFGRNDDPRCKGGGVAIATEDTRKSSSKGKGTVYAEKVQVEREEDHNKLIDDYVFDGRTVEDIASAMLKYADPDNFTVTASNDGATASGDEVFDPEMARASYDRYMTGLRPHEETRRAEIVQMSQTAWARNVLSNLIPGMEGLSEWTPPPLRPADPSRASGKTAEQLALESIDLSAKMMAARWGNDSAATIAATSAYHTVMQDIRDSGYTVEQIRDAVPMDSEAWKARALQAAATRLADPTLAVPLEEYLASRQFPFEEWVKAQHGPTAGEPPVEGKVVLNFEGSDGTEMVRVFKRDAQGRLVVKHEVFESSGAAGLAKDVLRGSFELYDQMGVRAVTTLANISTGAYSWARFGFLPSDSSEANNLAMVIRGSRLPEVTQRLRTGLDAYWDDSIETKLNAALQRLSEGNREALWEIADLRLTGTPEQIRPVARLFDSMSGPGDLYLKPSDNARWDKSLSDDAEQGVFNLGRVLLTGLGYHARFEMNARSTPQNAALIAKQHERLTNYIGDWKAKR